MRVIAVTGSASGIGAALRARLETAGERVIGADRRGAEVIADLGYGDGRAAAVARVEAACDGCLDGLVACAGVGPQVAPASAIVSIDYFGAQALLAGLRSSLAAAGGAAAVAVCSNSSTLPGADGPLAAACLAGDEEDARRLALARGGHPACAGAKVALARWVRRSAPGARWASAGVRRNAVAPVLGGGVRWNPPRRLRTCSSSSTSPGPAAMRATSCRKRASLRTGGCS